MMVEACPDCCKEPRCSSLVRIGYLRALIRSLWSEDEVTCPEFEEIRCRGLEGVRP